MAIVSISRIQHRRGLQQDLPSLASAELGWSIDEQRLFIGNGSLPEGAPQLGNTEILTEHSDILRLAQTYTFRNDDAGYIPSTGGRTVRINSVTYGNSLYVAVGTSGTILTSYDSNDWTPVYGGVTTNLNHVCYGNGKFVAVGASGTIIYSTDGLVWNKAILSIFLTFTSVVWAPSPIGNFVATSTDGSIILSTNAIEWSVSADPGDTGASDGLNSIDYFDGLLVAVGNNATVIYSTNASDWSSPSLSLPPIGSSNIVHAEASGYNLKAVKYVGEQWIATGDYSTVLISLDGLNWIYGYTDTFRASASNGTTTVFVGDGGIIYTATSININLVQSATLVESLLAISSTKNLYDIVWSADDSKFVAVGAAGTILTSPDGDEWTVQNSTVTEDLNKIIYDSNAGAYIVVGAAGTILTSSDYTNWAVRDSDTDEDLYSVALWSTTTYIAVGANGTIVTSPSLTAWSSTTYGTEDYNSIVVADLGGSTYKAVAVGTNGTLIYSDDSTTWNPCSSSGDYSNNLHGVNYVSYTYLTNPYLVYVAVGDNGTILISTDGDYWNPVEVGATNHLFSVNYSLGNFWITGSVGYGTIFGGHILDSATLNIQSLSVVFTATSGYNGPSLNGITIGNGSYVLVGQYDTTLTSQDGQNFVSQTQRNFEIGNLSTAELFDVIYENDMFTAMGNKGLILTSDDAISWSGISYSFGNSKTVRTIQAKLDDFVSVKDFGAKGDGLTDDTESINRALYELYCRTNVPAARKTLYFPAGKYIVSDGIRVPSNAFLRGEGPNNTIIQQTADPSFIEYVMITADSKQQIGGQAGKNGATLPSDIVIQDMTLQNNYDALWLINANRLSLLRVNLMGGQDFPEDAGNEWTGIYIIGNTMTPPTDIDISHCEFQGYNYGVIQYDHSKSRNIVIHSSTFQNMYKGLFLCADNGIGGGGVNTMTVSNCVFDSIYSHAIEADYAVNVTSTFNSFRDVGNYYLGIGNPQEYIINFKENSEGCASITDQFDRTLEDNNQTVAWINGNSHTAALHAGHEFRLGLYQQSGGETYTLTYNQTEELVGFDMLFDDLSYNKRVKYLISRNNRTRTGVLTITYDSVTNDFNLDDDSSETGDVGVVFNLIDAGDGVLSLQYTSDNSQSSQFDITLAEEYLKTVW